MGVKGSDVRIAKNDGIQAWPTIVSFAESPKRAGILYAVFLPIYDVIGKVGQGIR